MVAPVRLAVGALPLLVGKVKVMVRARQQRIGRRAQHQEREADKHRAARVREVPA